MLRSGCLLQAMLADMAVDIYAARSMVLNAAWEVDQGREPRAKISMVKLFASEMLGQVADRATPFLSLDSRDSGWICGCGSGNRHPSAAS